MGNKRKLEVSINKSTTLIQALKKMDEVNKRVLIIENEDDTFHSLISAGDIQRYLIKKQNFDVPVTLATRDKVIVVTTKESNTQIKSMMLKHRIELMPVINEDNKVDKVVFWDDLFDEKPTPQKKLDLPVVIMAGGQGTRLRPITHIIPKPLIPVGEKPIVQIICEKFALAGCKQFYFSVGYKANMLKAYFDGLEDKAYDIHYYHEDMPLGTAGSLSLIKDKISTPFFVSNCDIIIEQDYSEIYEYHKSNNNELTAVAFVKEMKIPYGTFEVEEGGLLNGLVEKPEFTFLVNAGMYILEPHLLEEIPSQELFHITHLMENIIVRNGRVGVFPISEGSWLDIGQWKEYQKTLSRYGYEIQL